MVRPIIQQQLINTYNYNALTTAYLVWLITIIVIHVPHQIPLNFFCYIKVNATALALKKPSNRKIQQSVSCAMKLVGLVLGPRSMNVQLV